MSYTIKPFEELDVIDDFLMNAIANDEEVNEEFFRTLLSVLLQREIGKIRITAQRIIPANTPTLRGIRLDVEIKEYDETDVDLKAKTIYDLEPHNKDGINLIKHNRFYQAKIDDCNMKSGEKNFIRLPNLFVITITNYDPFGYDYMMYTIHNKCDEIPELKYEDGLNFIYFNTKGTKGGNTSIKELLNYIQESKINNVTNEATKKLHDCVSRVRVSPEVRFEYMTFEEKIFYERLEAEELGRIKGKREAIIECLEEYGIVSDELSEKIEAENDLDKLKKWCKLACQVNSIEGFINKM